jgi:hypothetical protein
VYSLVFVPSDGPVNGLVMDCYRPMPKIRAYFNELLAGPILKANCGDIGMPY